MSAELILDPALREQFDDLGFAITPMLTPSDVAELAAVYNAVKSGLEGHFYTTLWSQDVAYKQKVFDAIQNVVGNRIHHYLGPGYIVLAQFAVKPKGKATSSQCLFHQDWSFVDESKFTPVSLWIPLVDVDNHNGTLQVIPGTHRAVTEHHRYNFPNNEHHSPYGKIWPALVGAYAREIPMSAGECILYNGAIAHGSPPNWSDEDRVAVVCVVIPEKATLKHYWRKSQTEVEVFNVEPDFFLTEAKVGARPDRNPDECLDYNASQYQLTIEGFVKATKGIDRTPKRTRFPASAEPKWRILADPEANRDLDRKGYYLSDLLSTQQLEEIRDIYESQRREWQQGFHADMFSNDVEYRKSVYSSLKRILDPVVERLCPGHRICIANFIVKEPDSESIVPLHQDWTIADPAVARTCNIFFPLTDVNLDNGCLHVVPGSHRTHRISIAPFDNVPLENFPDLAKFENMLPVPMKAGQGLVYDSSLLHASPANRTANRRLAVGVVVIPSDVPLRIYYKNQQEENGQLEIIQVNDDFFQSFDLSSKPTGGTLLGRIGYHRDLYTSHEIEAWSAYAQQDLPSTSGNNTDT